MAILHKFKKAIEAAVSARKESEHRIFKCLEEKTCWLGEELANEGRLRVEAISQLQNVVEQDLPKFDKMLSETKKGREAGDKELMHAIGEEIRKANDSLLQIRKTREKQANKIYEMVRQLAAKIKH